MRDNILLLSIRPHYAEQIFNGIKRVELRRKKPRIGAGDQVLVYVSSPTKEVQGFLQVGEVLEDNPEKLWLQVREIAGLHFEEFNNYFDGANQAYAIMIDGAKSLDEPVKLEVLRERWPKFRPPQCYQYLTYNQVSILLDMD